MNDPIINDNHIVITTLPELYNHFKDLFKNAWLCQVVGIVKHSHDDRYGCLGSMEYRPIYYDGKYEEKSALLFPKILRLARNHYRVSIYVHVHDQVVAKYGLLVGHRPPSDLYIYFEYVNKDVSPRWDTYSSLTREELAKTDKGYNDYILTHSSMTWTFQIESRINIVKYEDGELTKLLSKWNNIFSMVAVGLDKL